MKWTKIATCATALMAAGVILLPTTGQAAEVAAEKTTGKVQFQEPTGEDAEGGNPSQPGNPDEPVLPSTPGGSHTDGALRIEWVPNLDFGTQTNSSTTKNYPALFGTGTATIDGTAKTDAIMPTFVQVTDLRGGSSDGAFTLTVKQDAPFTRVGEDGNPVATTGEGDVLTNTRIELHNKQFINSVHANIDELVEGLTGVTDTTPVDIPVGAEAGTLTVLKTKEGKQTKNTNTSVVFTKDYAPDTFFTAAGQPTSTTDDSIQLRVPGSDITVGGATYTAKLTWTLSDTL